MDDLKQKGFINSIWSFLEQLIRKGFSIITTLVLTWLLVPEQFGLVAIVVIFIELSVILSTGGFGDAIIQNDNINQIDLDTIFFTNLAISFVTSALIFLTAPFIATYYEQPELTDLLRLASIAIIFSSASIVHNALLRKRLQFKLLFKIMLPANIISGIAAIILALIDYGVWALIIQLILNSFLTYIFYLRQQLYSVKTQFSFKKLKKHAHFSLPLLFDSVTNNLFKNLVPLVLASYYSLGLLGLYTIAFQIKDTIISQVENTYRDVSFPILSELNSQAPEQLSTTYIKLMQLLAYILFPIIIFFVSITTPLFSLFFKEEWQGAAELFQLLILSALFYPLYFVADNIFKTLGKTSIVFYFGLLRKASLLVLIIFTVEFGINAMLIGQIVLNALTLFAYNLMASKQLNTSSLETTKDFLKLLITAAIILAINLLILHLLDVFRFIEIVIIGLFTGLSYFLSCHFIGLRSQVFFLNKIRSIF